MTRNRLFLSAALFVHVVLGCGPAEVAAPADAGDSGASSEDAARDAASPIDSATQDVASPMDSGHPDGANCDEDSDGSESLGCGGSDCDDHDQFAYPGNAELCEGLLPDGLTLAEAHDEDCDPTTVGHRDADHDGQVDVLCCNGAGGSRICGTDCDDSRNVVFTGNSEVCDRFDNDCDTSIDEGVGVTYFDDCDGDGIGGGIGAVLCAPSICTGRPAVTSSSDCDDSNAAFHPGASGTCGICPGPSNTTEVCNGLDDDCSGTTDDNGAVSSCPLIPHGTSGCASGVCGIGSCDASYHACTGACVSSTAIESCGARCTACPTSADPNAHATCDGTSCAIVCNPPYVRVGAVCARLGASHVIDPTLLPSGTTALHVVSGQVVVIATDTGGIADRMGNVLRAPTGDTSGIGFSTQAQVGTGSPELAIFTFSTITVDAGGMLTATGSRALVLLASGDVEIAGVVDVSAGVSVGAIAGSPGPGGFAMGPSVGDPPTADGGAGGGGHAGRGGDGCSPTATAGAGGIVTAADASGTVLVGGSGGGGATGAAAAVGGGGGGALQISSLTTIHVGGIVRSVGAGGNNRDGGGGAGGTIFLEATTVRIDGVVTANGGGGGSYGGPGQSGTDSNFGATGGPSYIESGDGGRGAAGASLGGGGGNCGAYAGAAGGGAGGRIWFITLSGSRGTGGLVTPSGSVQERSATIP